MSGGIRLGAWAITEKRTRYAGIPELRAVLIGKHPSRPILAAALLLLAEDLVGLLVDDVQHRVGHVHIVDARATRSR